MSNREIENAQLEALFTRAPDLRSIANSIEPLFPAAADLLRGIARELDAREGVMTPATTVAGGDDD